MAFEAGQSLAPGKRKVESRYCNISTRTQHRLCGFQIHCHAAHRPPQVLDGGMDEQAVAGLDIEGKQSGNYPFGNRPPAFSRLLGRLTYSSQSRRASRNWS